MGKLLAGAALLALAFAAPVAARDNAPPGDGTDAAFFLCMMEGGIEIPLPLPVTLCCNPEWCVVCDSNLNNCREISAAEGRRLQTRPGLQGPLAPLQPGLPLAPD